jgi:hypothetical protein
MKQIFIIFAVVFLSSNIHSQCKPNITISVPQNLINNGTGFRVLVEVHATCPNGLYTYLVVRDGNKDYIEPPVNLGRIPEGVYRDTCYLGTINAGFPKIYTVFAIITTTPYNEYEHPDPKTINCTSNKITLTRKR